MLFLFLLRGSFLLLWPTFHLPVSRLSCHKAYRLGQCVTLGTVDTTPCPHSFQKICPDSRGPFSSYVSCQHLRVAMNNTPAPSLLNVVLLSDVRCCLFKILVSALSNMMPSPSTAAR
jgi:hypothetical protein